MSDFVSKLRSAGMSELACQFSQFIQRLDNSGDNVIAITAALVSEANSQGHVCLNLALAVNNESLLPLALPAKLSDWIRRLKQSHVVGESGVSAPLILTEQGLVYLYRYWQDEQQVANAILQRLQPLALVNKKQCQQDFADWRSDIEGVDWQKVAVLMAMTRKFTIISGGPGTGKTTIVLRLLNMLFNQDSGLKIALAAPTGKAAARLQQSINDSGQSDIEAKTLHRLLGITTHNEHGRYSQQRPLAIDVVIVDEASMIDISLMAKLIKSLSENTRLILLGDSQQLASIESGAVLANLCRDQPAFSTDFLALLSEVTGLTLANNEKQGQSALKDSVVKLQHSYRFDQQSDIGKLAKAVQTGNEQAVFEVITSPEYNMWEQPVDSGGGAQQVYDGYRPYFDAVVNGADAETCLQEFERFRVLCALKQGPESVSSVNELISRKLLKQGWRTNLDFYHGRPIMVTQNDYRQHLFNGDTGLVLRDQTGQLKACFYSENSLRWFELTRLPAHETAFAITVHKSQGSEFDKVCILLPEQDSAILNRELLYTAITRAKKQVMLLCTQTILTKTISTQHQRQSGLVALLTAKLGM